MPYIQPNPTPEQMVKVKYVWHGSTSSQTLPLDIEANKGRAAEGQTPQRRGDASKKLVTQRISF